MNCCRTHNGTCWYVHGLSDMLLSLTECYYCKQPVWKEALYVLSGESILHFVLPLFVGCYFLCFTKEDVYVLSPYYAYLHPAMLCFCYESSNRYCSDVQILHQLSTSVTVKKHSQSLTALFNEVSMRTNCSTRPTLFFWIETFISMISSHCWSDGSSCISGAIVFQILKSMWVS